MKPAVVTAHVKNQQKPEVRARRLAHRECLGLKDLAECLLDAYESVTNRAHQKYLDRGGAAGQDLDDWMDAERELLPEVHADFEESEKFLYALASVRDFAGAEISVAVEPRWLLILARSEGEEKPESVVSGADAPRQCFSIFELSAQVDRAGTIAVLSDGLLAVRMPKGAR
jgi:HSP20 family molecular chaperone IbpA